MNIQWVSGARPLPVKRRFGGLFGLSEQEQSCVCGKGEPDECYALGDGDVVETADLVGGWLHKNL